MSTVLINPFENPDAYNYITLDGIDSPGPCELTSDSRRALKIEVQQSIGFTGGYLAFRGEELPLLEYRLRLWAGTHYRAGGKFVDLLMEGYAKRLHRVLRLEDQSIAHLKFFKVVVESIGGLKKLQDGDTKREVNFALRVYGKRQEVKTPPRGPKSDIEKQIESLESENALLDRQLQAAELAQSRGK